MEVGALQALDQFSFTKAQLEKLQQLAQGTAQKDSKRKAAKASEEYRDKLQALGAALARGKDRERIFKLHDELAALRQKEKPTFDDRVEMTEAAGKRAGEAFRMLKAGQLAFYIGQIAEDIADPVDRLIGSLQDVRTMSDEEWQEQRDDIADDISRMAAGPDQVKSKPIREQVSALLLRTRNLTKIDYEKQQPELDRSARKIIGDISPFDVLRHHVELDLAILLSNPRLPPALQARLAAPQK